ncbi:MAG: PepSY domain-containing protein [Clostridia bacterium]|nr:PepSY domain-containing protein [Clostridia bacterium]
MKKKTIIVTAILCVACLCIGASAASIIQDIKAQLRPDFTVYVDGEKQVFRDVNGNVVDPILYEGTTYLPLRAIGQLMGKTVYWYEDEKKIELKETTVTDADVIVHDDAQKNTQKQEEKQGEKQEKAAEKEQKKEEKLVEKPKEKTVEEAADFIGEEKAKAIALEKAGFSESEVRMERVKLDRENGQIVYEVEFNKDRVEYSAEISAADGTIVSWDVDYDD